jgi:DNA-binding MarR family transcriptional regulator
MIAGVPTIGSLVWHLAMRWRNEVDRAVAPFALTHAQYSVLSSLAVLSDGGNEPTQRMLADFTRLQAIYISRIVQALEAAGHIVRRPDKDDSRAFRLTLTPAGEATITEARKIVRALDERLTRVIGGSSGARANQLRKLLGNLIDHVDQPGEE